MQRKHPAPSSKGGEGVGFSASAPTAAAAAPPPPVKKTLEDLLAEDAKLRKREARILEKKALRLAQKEAQRQAEKKARAAEREATSNAEKRSKPEGGGGSRESKRGGVAVPVLLGARVAGRREGVVGVKR